MSDVEQKFKEAWKDLVELSYKKDAKVEYLGELVQELYEEPKDLKNDRKFRIEYMKEGLSDDKKKILETTDAMLGHLTKPELKQFKKERSNILSYLGLLFNEVGRQAFTEKRWSKGNPVKKGINDAKTKQTDAGKLNILTKL